MFPLHKPPSVKAVMVAVGISLTVAGIAHGGLLARGKLSPFFLLILVSPKFICQLIYIPIIFLTIRAKTHDHECRLGQCQQRVHEVQ